MFPLECYDGFKAGYQILEGLPSIFFSCVSLPMDPIFDLSLSDPFGDNFFHLIVLLVRVRIFFVFGRFRRHAGDFSLVFKDKSLLAKIFLR